MVGSCFVFLSRDCQKPVLQKKAFSLSRFFRYRLLDFPARTPLPLCASTPSPPPPPPRSLTVKPCVESIPAN